MARRPPSRPLTSDERRLWAEVARSVRRLNNPVATPEPIVEDAATQPPAAPTQGALSKTRRAAAAPLPAPPKPSPPPLTPLAAIERLTTRRLARGTLRPEATIDLHGMTQAVAHSRLIGFLRRARADDLGLVQVITGRGSSDGQYGSERGVLRRTVPLWLSLPELRSLVLGFGEAGPRQGGSGALYVRLRRRRGPA